MSNAASESIAVSRWEGLVSALLERLAAEGGNVVMSPASVLAALGMVAAGARGKTARAFEEVLGAAGEIAELSRAVAKVASRQSQTARDGSAALDWACALWMDEALQPLAGFVRGVREGFGASVCVADFAGRPQEARGLINWWASQHTRHEVRELLPEGAVSGATRLVLANALRFQAAWEVPFITTGEREVFHVAPGWTCPAVMLYADGEFAYADAGAYEAVELPYAGGTYSMVVVLPRRGAGGVAVAPRLESVVAGFTRRWVSVQLPRFGVSCAYGLREALGAVGLGCLLGEDADLAGITGTPGLMVDEVYHAAALEVDEHGSRAAAGTAAVCGVTACAGAVFRANRPFWYFVRERTSGAVLFAGRVAVPSG